MTSGKTRWKRTSQLVGIGLLTVAHVTALLVGGYDEWPTWAAVLNFLGLVLLLIPTLGVRVRH